MARLNLTVPDSLYERLERLRDRVNVSKICAVALTKELDMLETTATVTTATVANNEAKVDRMVQRFLRQREIKEIWYRRGRHDGEQWAIDRATLEELRMMGEEWNEHTVADCDNLNDVDPDEYPTINIRSLLKEWVRADAQTAGADQQPEEADWRAYLHGWYHSARDLWQAAKPALQ